jgi:hypothetical protein
MENSINYYYKLNEGKLTDSSRKIGKFSDQMLCVVQCAGDFYRALILSQTNTKTQVNLFDYGVISSVDSDKVYPLLKEFSGLPPMCVKCSLMHIKPNNVIGTGDK